MKAPVLFIVGGEDNVVIEMNRNAMSRINSEKKLVIVHGATHLFQEPGTFDQVVRLAAEGFVNYLKSNQTEIGVG
ncbi:MAG: alpha/beta hydrolase [Dehalococcoidales bacterium]|nr:alpha/beta hydrolase [Dehalococcoidales bacterium]